MSRVAAIALMLNGCALGASDSVDRDADPLSRAMTRSIAALLATDLAEKDAVTGALGVDWSLVTEDPIAGGIYSGRARELPLDSVRYERWLVAPHTSRLTMKVTQAHCYDARALVFEFAPEHLTSPSVPADGEEAGIASRAYFSANDKTVFLAYRRELSDQRSCVAEIVVLQPAP